MADKKTPSARVVAAQLVLELLSRADGITTEELTQLSDSRISSQKRQKVLVFVDKLTSKFRERMDKIMSKFRNPPFAKSGKKPTFGKK